MSDLAAPAPKSLARVLEQKTTLYFSRNAGKVFLRGRNLVCRSAEGQEREFLLGRIRRVVLIGKAGVDAAVIYRIMRCGIPIDWLDVFGRPLGQLLSLDDTERAVAKQVRFRNSSEALELSRNVLLAKFDNCHEIIRRKTTAELPWAERRAAIEDAANAGGLRGAEGMAARMYFSCWHDLLRSFQWKGRHPHPAPDPVNMLLSLGYGLLHNRLSSALHNAGFNPRIGFFHVSRGRHCALASDLMEPFRAFVDGTVLSLIRHNEVKPENFAMKGERCVCADQKIFARLLLAFEEMFAARHAFYYSLAEPDAVCECPVNDAIDNLAGSFAAFLEQKAEIFLPRLTPCPST